MKTLTGIILVKGAGDITPPSPRTEEIRAKSSPRVLKVLCPVPRYNNYTVALSLIQEERLVGVFKEGFPGEGKGWDWRREILYIRNTTSLTRFDLIALTNAG
jgi:hypothetical protein